MVEQKGAKLKQLETDLPEGLIVDAAWMEAKGIATNLRTYYVKNDWLEQPTRGVYRRPRGSLGWQQVVISLQTLLLNVLKGPFLVGGRTALELQGLSHYLSQETKTIHLYGPHKPPNWLYKLPLPQEFVYHNSETLFQNAHALASLAVNLNFGTERDLTSFQGGSLETLSWGQWDWPLTLSRPERAYLELLDELPNKESFHQADMFMQGAVNFSPRRLQKLLEDCRSVKVKRLFFFFADRHQHSWLKRIDKKKIDLGKGNRMLVKGGRFDPVYQITVPEDIDADQ